MTAWRNAGWDGLTTNQRGYGRQHKAARAAAAKVHHPDDPCARCGHPLGPMGPWLHLDHTDDRTSYLGFSHGSMRCPTCGVRCNELAAARRGAAVSNQGAPTTLRW